MFDELNPGAASAGSGNGAAPPAAPGSGVPGSPPAGSVAAPPAAPPAVSWETAPEKLRAEYEQQKTEAARLKAEAEKWSKLGNYDQVSQLHGSFSQRLTQATTIGKSLGYTEQQIREAMTEDPKGTLQYLQQEYAKPASESREVIDKRLQSLVDERVKPIQERYDETINREATSRYEGERERLYKAEFGDGLPDDNKEELFEILDGLVASDEAALQRLKFTNQVSDVGRHMAQAKVIFTKRHNSYIAHERGRSGKEPPPNGAPKDPKAKTERRLSDGTLAKDLLAW